MLISKCAISSDSLVTGKFTEYVWTIVVMLLTVITKIGLNFSRKVEKY